MNATEEAVQHKTCRITIVSAGQSDSVIKVYPAEHAAEKIWLTNTPGIERWEEVQRVINLHADRNKPIPKPIKYHSSITDLKTVEIHEADIPTVNLENFVLKAPKQQDLAPGDIDKMPQSQQSLQARIDALEGSQRTQTALLERVLGLLEPPKGAVVAPPPGPVSIPQGDSWDCPKCQKEFKSSKALGMHSRSHEKKEAA